MSNTKSVNNRVQTIIDSLPDNAKFPVLNSMVGAINCSIIGTANSVVARLERQDIDFVTMSPHEVIHMMSEADMRADMLHNVRALVRVRNNLRDQLLAVANDDDVASWAQSIEFMTQPSATSRIDQNKLGDVYKLCGLDDETIEILKVAALAEESRERARSAEQISARQGHIEWLIETVFSGTEYYDADGKLVDDTNKESSVESLPAVMQDRLFDKFRSALQSTLTRTASRFAQGDRRYELNDVIVINAAIKEANELEAHSDDELATA